jgi:hypothetical protein
VVLTFKNIVCYVLLYADKNAKETGPTSKSTGLPRYIKTAPARPKEANLYSRLVSSRARSKGQPLSLGLDFGAGTDSVGFKNRNILRIVAVVAQDVWTQKNEASAMR